MRCNRLFHKESIGVWIATVISCRITFSSGTNCFAIIVVYSNNLSDGTTVDENDVLNNGEYESFALSSCNSADN